MKKNVIYELIEHNHKMWREYTELAERKAKEVGAHYDFYNDDIHKEFANIHSMLMVQLVNSQRQPEEMLNSREAIKNLIKNTMGMGEDIEKPVDRAEDALEDLDVERYLDKMLVNLLTDKKIRELMADYRFTVDWQKAKRADAVKFFNPLNEQPMEQKRYLVYGRGKEGGEYMREYVSINGEEYVRTSDLEQELDKAREEGRGTIPDGWLPCGYKDCGAWCQNSTALTRHMENIHGLSKLNNK
jgi:hypothetical protein